MPETPVSPTPSAPSAEHRPVAPTGDRPRYAGKLGAPRLGGAPRPGGKPLFSGGPRGRRPMPRRKVCRFCADKIAEVDYKAVPILRGFLTVRGKMLSGRTTGNCARHQRQLTTAIKRAQNLALLPYVGE